jgi:alpha-glucosidase
MKTKPRTLSGIKSVTRALALLPLVVCMMCAAASAQTAETPPLKLLSPGGQVEITFTLGEDGAPAYSVAYRGQTVIAPSSLGLEFKQGGLLSKGLRFTGARRGSRDETYALVAGKTRQARDHYTELTVSLEEGQAPGRKLELVFRAYDDGAAFRYRLPPQEGMKEFEITAERTSFVFPTDLGCWALQLGSFNNSYEAEFDHMTSSRIRPDSILGLPLVCKTRDERATFALTEADLDDYAGMHFAGLTRGYGVTSLLSPRRDDKTVAVRGAITRDGFRTPWRVVMVADSPGRLIESTLVTNLNPPTEIQDTSWIRPGKAAWDWWSGRVVEGASFKTGMNDETMRSYIDLAAAMGWEYTLVDAGWYSHLPEAGDRMDPHADITKTIPEINLPGLIAYARERGVGLWVWVHWRLANEQMDAAFPFYERLGIRGVKVDFMDSDDQPMVEFYHRVLKTAAEHHLLVDLHGAYKPTGLVRTYPNYLTQEGVMGAEYNKWSARVTATHNVTLPFTRMLLGPMDYTPGAFRNATPADFKIQFVGPEVMTTRAQQLAMYVVYESPFACVSDSPGAYRNQTGADFLKAVPSSWDETRVLGGDIGEYVVVARRRGREWYVGAMTNERGREVEVPLSFLGGGDYRLTLYADGARPVDVVTTVEEVKNGRLKGAGVVRLKLAPSGGSAMRFTPAG